MFASLLLQLPTTRHAAKGLEPSHTTNEAFESFIHSKFLRGNGHSVLSQTYGFYSSSMGVKQTKTKAN